MKFETIRYEDLGKAEHGWLHANFHFSFANYFNPNRMGFGHIRVINDDLIEPHNGFPDHPHKDMEIITFVRKGAITHKDSMGNEGRTEAGDIQVMSAGTGVTHSEYNLEDELTNIYQIWVFPDKKEIEPRWDSDSFKNKAKNQVNLLVDKVGSKKDCLKVNQDIRIFSIYFDELENQVVHSTDKMSYILASEGNIMVKELGITLSKGDAVQIEDLTSYTIISKSNISEVIIIET